MHAGISSLLRMSTNERQDKYHGMWHLTSYKIMAHFRRSKMLNRKTSAAVRSFVIMSEDKLLF